MREREHRRLELFRQRLERARDLGDLGRAVLALGDRLHELQVVDDDGADLAAVLTREPARSRAQLQRVERRRFIDVNGRLGQPAERLGQPFPVIGYELAGSNLVLIEAAHRSDQAHGELHRAHLHAEDPDRQLGRERDMLGDVERQGGLAHARTSRDHDEVAFLQAGGQVVQIGESRRHTGDVGRIVTVKQELDALDRLREQRAQLLESLLTARAVLGDLEHLRLGLVEDFAYAAAQRIVSGVGDLSAGGRQATQDRPLAHNLGVAADIGRGWHILDQRAEISHAADVIELLE